MKPLIIMPWRNEATHRKKSTQRAVLKLWMKRGVRAPHPHRFSVSEDRKLTPTVAPERLTVFLVVLMGASAAGRWGVEPVGVLTCDSSGLGKSTLGTIGPSCRSSSSCLELKELSLLSRWGMTPFEKTLKLWGKINEFQNLVLDFFFFLPELRWDLQFRCQC